MPETSTPAETTEKAVASPVGGARIKGERRVVTVLFADVVNSTGLAEKLDPEDWTEIMNGAFPLLTAPVRRYEGTVGRLMGDGMLAFFGAPTSHEDDPQRAILAALDIVEAVKAYGSGIRKSYGIDFEVRVGVNTGPVVVADVGSAAFMEQTAMGDAVNVAARMQSTAAPNTIRIAAETHKLVARLFDTEPLGDIELKGKSEPVAAYRVVGLKADPARFRTLAGVSAPLVGRNQELDLLKHAVDQVRQGRGQIVCLVGEAGLGKSRLLAELRQYWLESGEPDFQWDGIVGVPYDIHRPFGLFQNFARGMFGVQLDDPADVIHRKVEETFIAMGGPPEAMALCAVAMERVIAAKALHEAKEDYAAEVVKADLYQNLYPAIANSARSSPRVIVFDDLQWADQASVDLVIHLLGVADEAPILYLLAMRPERQSAGWQAKVAADTNYPHRYTEIVLRPLDAADTDALVAALLDIDDLPEDLRALVMRKTEGNPYFVEEVVHSLIEQGAVYESDGRLQWNPGTAIADIAIPDSLQALLMARMDRLDQETRSTLQIASVIGRSFYYRILLAISDSAMTVDKHLRSLERVELLREAGRQPELEYIFKHELARDAAYATILNRRRREFHLRVAEAIETLFEGRLEEHAHRLAQHFELAGDDERAARYFEMAGDVALSLHAQTEAEAHFGRALAAARRLPEAADAINRLEAKLPTLAMN
jgi:class 3 adenylate cyclase